MSIPHTRPRALLAGAGAVTLLLAGALTACGGSGSSTKDLQVLTSAPSGANAAASRAYYGYLAKLFHQQTGATVHYSYYSSSSQEDSKIQSSVATHSGPDVISVGSSFDGTISGTHAFHVLSTSDWNAIGGRSSFESQMLTESGPSAGKDVGVPYESIPYVLAYNKSLLAKAGITAPPTTWQQYLDDAQQVQKATPGVSGTGMDPADSYDPWKIVWSYTLQSGGDFVSKDAKKATFTTTPVQQAMTFYFSQYTKYHIVPKDSLTWNSTNLEAAFAAGRIAMMPDATYQLAPETKGTPAGQDVAFAPMPAVPVGLTSRPDGAPAAQSIVSGNYWTIGSWAGSVPLALKWIKTASSTQAQLKQFDLLGQNPITNAAITALQQQHPEMKPFIEAQANSTPTTFTPAWNYIEEGILAAIAHTAQQVATSGYSTSYVLDQLRAENAAVQPHLAGS